MKRKTDGSYTLEAAVLFPLILFIITALLYTCFLLHDKAVIEGKVHLTVLNGEKAAKKCADPVTGEIDYESYLEEGIFRPLYDNSEEAASMKTALQNTITEKVMFARIYSVTVEIKGEEITASVNYGFDMPIRGIEEFLKSGGTKFIYEEEKSFDNNEEFIRVFQVATDSAKELPGADSILKTLQKSIGILQ
ncbi:TadE family protein [Anaerocolumna xylanovorans]|uniref:TadE-like protein n=1 Tax=Anaerocolumna xylanovorans DSM 12503 TaxID=1121345 RepID=A0A1M7YMU0_9FIRM|nr:TadE family protein [Anaerocolumna xylanovorans]SHO53856.1 TadE-like protein [Anaerocolumna xylanovorans DSM 12503]